MYWSIAVSSLFLSLPLAIQFSLIPSALIPQAIQGGGIYDDGSCQQFCAGPGGTVSLAPDIGIINAQTHDSDDDDEYAECEEGVELCLSPPWRPQRCDDRYW